jgi:hypothetical protein
VSGGEAPQGSRGGTGGRVLAGLLGAAVVGFLLGMLALPRLIGGADSGTRLSIPTVAAQQPVVTPTATAIPPTPTPLPPTPTPTPTPFPPTPTATPVPPTATPPPPTATPTQVPTPTRPPSSVFAPEPTDAPPPQAPEAAAPPANGGTATPTGTARPAVTATGTPTATIGPFVATHVVASDLPVNFRAGPGTTYPSQGALAPGTRLAATGNAQTTDGALWLEFRLATGALGWILAPFVAPV